ncbi:hypothetical protein [Pseudomonas putida]|uniref:Uncharacterized protein n=1 Tax=Pseudomonas putida TaxID=303 RepID=A0A8I1E9N2_PSEPU|nr:hypothetical protein [Pseudomonas putida]MBI6882345.1 hypothetical protein [Pseudomonas putida]
MFATFQKKCLRHAVSTTVFNIEAKTFLEKNTGVKIDDLIFYLGTIRYELESSLTPLLHQLNEINVEFFYLKRRLENGFYNSYRTEMPESLKPRKIKNGFYHMSIGRDSYSYDSLPWTLHNFSATIYDQSNTLAAYVNGSVYVSKCSYSVDAEDLVYAADHVDDLDVSMASQAMEQIIQDFGDDDDYTYVFDSHVIIFIQTWERRFDAPAGFGGKLLEKTIKEICRKYKMPAILICLANSPKILSDDKNAPALKDIIGRAQQRVIDSYEKVFNRLDDTSDCVEYVCYTDKLFNKTDVQRAIGSFYGNLFKGL